MGGWTGIWQWVIVLVIVLLLFGGRGKISQLMGDLGKGLKSFKKSMSNDEADAPKEAPKTIDGGPGTASQPHNTAQSQSPAGSEPTKKE
ncbi:MAG: twin-arginine translocase TatA/TatE family subunit [Rhodospirillales bacterium]